jgi:GNS1/SUR4 family
VAHTPLLRITETNRTQFVLIGVQNRSLDQLEDPHFSNGTQTSPRRDLTLCMLGVCIASAWYSCALNSLVHVLMYTYYLLAQLLSRDAKAKRRCVDWSTGAEV